MTVAELRDMLANLPDSDRVCFAVWFSEGERLYRPHRELGEMRTAKSDQSTYHVLGRCDNCLAHRLDGRPEFAVS